MDDEFLFDDTQLTEREKEEKRYSFLIEKSPPFFYNLFLLITQKIIVMLFYEPIKCL